MQFRHNRPAQGYWFVPGGRIRKDAFLRLVSVELGVECSLDKAEFLGPYEHFYQDDFSGTSFSTHYVVLGYSLTLDIDLAELPDDQHHDYRWYTVDELFSPLGTVCK